ncbi:MFS-type transporter C16A3.17c 1 [Phlyctema vagabunda]|uniref:MFS-type transporter C16A3.17c 1 n=1 Tax=Phlyctema vagabunda TaxID=108571 RepID=A0ABR4P5Y6_9HELO
MIAVLYFVDIYFTLVQGLSASKSGTQLLYYLPGLAAGVYLAVCMCNWRPRQTFLPLFLGSVIEAISLTVLTWALHKEDSATIYAMIAVAGCGTGLRFMPGSLHGVAFFPNHIASVVSLVALAIPFGGTIAMTIMGSVFNNKTGLTQSPSIEGTTHAAGPAEKDMVKRGVVWAYIAILPFMWLAVLAAAALGNVYISPDKKVNQQGQLVLGGHIDEGPYLISLLKRMRNTTATEEIELRTGA